MYNNKSFHFYSFRKYKHKTYSLSKRFCIQDIKVNVRYRDFYDAMFMTLGCSVAVAY